MNAVPRTPPGSIEVPDHFDALIEKFGEPKDPRIPRTMEDRSVRVSPEFLRIQGLPKRQWAEAHELGHLMALLTEGLKTPGGMQSLRPVQAAALREAHDLRGALLPIRVGGGKTLVSLLAPLVLGAKRPVLFVPAALRAKTRIEARKLALHWRIPAGIRVFSYEILSRAAPGWLDTCCAGQPPDLIVADEVHKLKSQDAGCTRAVRAFMRKHKHGTPTHVPFVGMSGSITARGLKDYRHILVWCLGEHAPVPRDAYEGLLWGLALDEKVAPEQRADPGPLEQLVPGETFEGDALSRARQAFGSRLVSSPGVVTTKEDIPQTGLTITATHMDAPPKIREAIEWMRQSWCTPDDHPFESAIQLWQHANEMAGGGFYYVWDPRPPSEWLEARKAWSKFVRGILAHSQSLHTPLHVVSAIHSKQVDDGGLYAEWKAIEPTFEPNSVPVGIDDTTLNYAAKWLEEHPDTGLVWVSHKYSGRRLSELSGVPYFGASAMDVRSGKLVEEHNGSAIVSIASCREGRNLQRWNANLVLVPPTVGSWWEQLLGRTHRDGQEADEVTCEIPLMLREQYEALQQAIQDAEYTQLTTGMPQKLVYATKDIPDLREAIESGFLL